MEKECDELSKSNQRLEAKVKSLTECIEHVDWYIKYMEDGKDPKYAIQDCYKQKKEIIALKEKLKDKTMLFEATVASLE